MARHRLIQDHAGDEAPPSARSSLEGFQFTNEYQRLSFQYTEPSRDQYSASAWTQAAEGSQYYHSQDFQLGDSSDDTQVFQDTSRTHAVQAMTLPMIESNHLNGDCKHWDDHSSSPHGNHSNTGQWAIHSPHGFIEVHKTSGSANGSDHADKMDSEELMPSLSQMSFSTSTGHSDVMETSSSLPDNALYTSSPQYLENYTYSELNYQDTNDARDKYASYHHGLSVGVARRPNHLIPVAPATSFSSFHGHAEDIMLTSPMDLASLVGSSAVPSKDSPPLDSIGSYLPELDWDAYTDTRVPSPSYSIDEFSIGPPISSFGDMALDPTIDYYDQSPRYVGIPSHGVCVFPLHEQLARTTQTSSGQDDHSAEEFPAYLHQRTKTAGLRDDMTVADLARGRRGSPENENIARDHPLYQNATTGADGLYHCPWEGKNPSCGHKPEKLKCNYDKFVDSHLKPYRCKVIACENSKFSSTACLLRHEREAHAMHGHGEKPFLCTSEGCDRGIPGQGFPRHWNLRDHMKRVHQCSPDPNDVDQPVRGARKRKSESRGVNSKKKNPATSPVIKKESPRLIEVSLEEHFNMQRRQLISSMEHLGDPTDPEALDKLRLANNCLKEMATASQRIRATPRMSRTASQQSG